MSLTSKTRRPGRSLGFTLIEMLIVISILMVLLAIAVPNYSHHVILAKEARLHQDLTTLNKVIQEYSLDKKHAPQSLDDLVQAGYLKFIPNDITGSNTWVTEPEDSEQAMDPNNTGIGSVHSGSSDTALGGETCRSVLSLAQRAGRPPDSRRDGGATANAHDDHQKPRARIHPHRSHGGDHRYFDPAGNGYSHLYA
jgi:general secretion pathway protein G